MRFLLILQHKINLRLLKNVYVESETVVSGKWVSFELLQQPTNIITFFLLF